MFTLWQKDDPKHRTKILFHAGWTIIKRLNFALTLRLKIHAEWKILIQSFLIHSPNFNLNAILFKTSVPWIPSTFHPLLTSIKLSAWNNRKRSESWPKTRTHIRCTLAFRFVHASNYFLKFDVVSRKHKSYASSSVNPASVVFVSAIAWNIKQNARQAATRFFLWLNFLSVHTEFLTPWLRNFALTSDYLQYYCY